MTAISNKPLSVRAQQQLRDYDPRINPAAVLTGGSVDYYKARIEHPTTAAEPYTAECNDVIEALGMSYAEGNIFKAIWRRCAARKGTAKRGYDTGLYDAEKVKFFAERLIAQEKAKSA